MPWRLVGCEVWGREKGGAKTVCALNDKQAFSTWHMSGLLHLTSHLSKGGRRYMSLFLENPKGLVWCRLAGEGRDLRQREAVPSSTTSPSPSSLPPLHSTTNPHKSRAQTFMGARPAPNSCLSTAGPDHHLYLCLELWVPQTQLPKVYEQCLPLNLRQTYL